MITVFSAGVKIVTGFVSVTSFLTDLSAKEGRTKEEKLLLDALKRRVDIMIQPLNLCIQINKSINSMSMFPIEHAKSVVDEMNRFLKSWTKSPTEYKSTHVIQMSP